MSKLTNDLCSRCEGRRFLIDNGAAKICPKCDGKGHYTHDRFVSFLHVFGLLLLVCCIVAALTG